jgi:hypothetical protein
VAVWLFALPFLFLVRIKTPLQLFPVMALLSIFPRLTYRFAECEKKIQTRRAFLTAPQRRDSNSFYAPISHTHTHTHNCALMAVPIGGGDDTRSRRSGASRSEPAQQNASNLASQQYHCEKNKILKLHSIFYPPPTVPSQRGFSRMIGSGNI